MTTGLFSHPMTLLVFDLMDTVVTDPFYTALPDYLGLSFSQMLALKHPTSWLYFEQGQLDEATFLQQFYHPVHQLNLPDPKGLRQLFFDYYQFLPGMEELLWELKQQGTKLWVLSNYPEWFEHIRVKLSLDRFFDGYTLSYQCGFRKPAPQSYQAVEQAHPQGPFLLIDDRPANIQGAQLQGWQGILFHGAASLRPQLGL